jgi:GNAT superfamily N-acetyltransferase
MEKNVMIVRLQNLSLRAPILSDLHMVAELIMLCDTTLFDSLQRGKEAFTHNWHAPQFDLLTDAWVIVTHEQNIVAYADVHQEQEDLPGVFTASVCIHPRYRHLGMGTLLLRLAEMRARQLMCDIVSDLQIALQFVMSGNIPETREFFESEGYTLTRQLWRLRLAMPLTSVKGVKKSYRHGALDVDVTVAIDRSSETVEDQTRADTLVVSQYDVYEKVLCTGKQIEDPVIAMGYALV